MEGFKFGLKRFLAERQVFVSIVIFGVMGMLSDLFSELNWHIVSITLKIVAIFSLIGIFVIDLLFRRKRDSIKVPLIFTTQSGIMEARRMFKDFTHTMRLNSKVIQRVTNLSDTDLLIQLDYDPRTQKNPESKEHWLLAWRELLEMWEFIDHTLKKELPSGETYCYHIYPHIWLPLSFAMGASVNLRRPIVLYHRQANEFYRVIDLSEPRKLFEEPDPSIPPPEKIPENFDTLPNTEKLILHLCISERHTIPDFKAHPDYEKSANAGLVYRFTLDPTKNWLGYVQWLFKESKPLLGRYKAVDICLAGTSPIVFALGMAFSRTPKITVCDYQNGLYIPVFSLMAIEKRLPFD